MRIEEIVVNNYRAFCNQTGEENERYKISLSGGKNLLIYGENGSGKSSLFKAFQDFFLSASNKHLEFSKNIFYKEDEVEEKPFIKISFNDGTSVLPFYFSSDFARINTDTGFLKEAGKTKSFMSYRELMQIHFINKRDVNLFDFLIGEGGLLSELPNPSSTVPETKLTFSELWKKVYSDPDETALNDLNNGISIQLAELTKYLNKLLNFFDDRVEASFEFKPLTRDEAKEKRGIVGLKVIYCKKEIPNYHLFLNEARLTALAISIYLSAHLSVPKSQYEILFLDDVFTGLDTSNRLPLLNILSSPSLTGNSGDTFLKHQIFLTTYDRQWFDLAKQHLGPNWNSVELYVGELSDKYTIRPILFDTAPDYLQRAISYFEAKDYPACANYQRKECERLIKQFLPENLKYDPDINGDIKPIRTLGTLFDKLQNYCRKNNLDISVLDEFKNYSKVVLNPLSHDDLESPAYRRELEEVFEIIGNLRKLRNTPKLEAGTVIVFEKHHTKTRVRYHYKFELRSNVRILSFDTIKVMTPITVIPIGMKRIDRNGEKILTFSDRILQKITKLLKLKKKHREFDIRYASLQKMYDYIIRHLQAQPAANFLDEFFIERQDKRVTLKEVLEGDN